jgi:hypothetical protein
MPLTIETGAGVPNADSYATALQYEEFATAYYGDDTDASEAAMRRAWAYMNSLAWKGSKTYGRGQSSAVPRVGLVDCDGNAISDDEVPAEVVQAQLEFARAETLSPGVLSPQGSLRDSVVNMEKVDVIQVGYDTSRLQPGIEAAQVIVEAGMRLISCYLVNGGRLGVRRTDAVVV